MKKNTKHSLIALFAVCIIAPICYKAVSDSGLNNDDNLIGNWKELGAPKSQTDTLKFDRNSVYFNGRQINKYTINNARNLSFVYGNKIIDCNLMGRDRLVCENLRHYKISFKKEK